MSEIKSLGNEEFDEPDIIDAAPSEEFFSVYSRLNEAGEADKQGKYILFGSYPTSLLDDEGIIAELNARAADPTKDKNKLWISYKYYKGALGRDIKFDAFSARNSLDYMWYTDIELGGIIYRGVYFTHYRPYWTSELSKADKSYQDDNGYTVNTVYWFKYEMLRWAIAEERDGMARLVSERLIDAQAYQSLAAKEGDYMPVKDDFYILDNKGKFVKSGLFGRKIHANIYEHSTIRKWLNADFYSTAFCDYEQELISEQDIDNSAPSTGALDNRYISKNTRDRISLLCVKEAEGIGESGRRIAPTDYARCQGINLEKYDKYSWWWLRSPYADAAHSARAYDSAGKLNYYNVIYTIGGVRPVMWIRL